MEKKVNPAVSNVLQVENLYHSYPGTGVPLEVLRDINLGIPASSMVAIRGSSGSGKSTLLLACGAMQQPTRGRVRVCDQDVFDLSLVLRSHFRAHKIGYLFQTLQLIPYLNVIDNIRVVRGVSSTTAKHWLTRLGLADRLHHKPRALSHGQRQRVALARAIAHRPALVLADEPTGNLDAANSELVFTTLRDYANEGGAVLIASHDATVSEFSDQVLQLESGTLAMSQSQP